MKEALAVVVNLGGPQALTVARAVRECGVFCEVLPAAGAEEALHARAPKAVIVTGNRPDVPAEAAARLPGLGSAPCPTLQVGAGTALPVEALFGGAGRRCLATFLTVTCGCPADWSAEQFVRDAEADLRLAAAGRRVLVPVAGDGRSLAAAVLTHRALEDAMTALLPDTGLLRQNEAEELSAALTSLGVPFIRRNVETRFLYKLLGVEDPQRKKALIEEEYAATLAKEAAAAGAECLVLPTLYAEQNAPRLAPPGWEEEQILHPFKPLLPTELPALAAALELPPAIANRPPLPLYGLAVRCPGALTMERLELARAANALVEEELPRLQPAGQPLRCFAAVAKEKTAALRGSRAGYEHTLILRAVTGEDEPFAAAAELPAEALQRLVRRLTTELSGVGRVLYDLTACPPAALELE